MKKSADTNGQQPSTPTRGVRVDELQVGMILAEDLKHFNGRMILQKGDTIGTKDIRIIKMWGVPEAVIEQEGPVSSPSKASPTPEYIERLQKVVDMHFRFNDLDHAVSRELKRLCMLNHAGSAQRLLGAKKFSDFEGSIETRQRSMPLDDAEAVIQNTKLPSLPAIVVRINEAINNPNCTATHIAGIISKDAGLTARLLKLVNSPFYSFPSEISSIARAVTIIGSRQLSTLAVGTVAASTFRNIPQDVLDMTSFWMHSIACGIIARILSSYKKNSNTENYFLAGLLHDIGRLIIYQNFPIETAEIFSKTEQKSRMLNQVEKEVLGCDHAELGSILIQKWQLSNMFEQGCRYHNHPMEAPDPTMVSIIHVADIIANAMYFGNSGERYVPQLEPGAWEEIGLPVSILAPTISQTNTLLKETIHYYLPR